MSTPPAATAEINNSIPILAALKHVFPSMDNGTIEVPKEKLEKFREIYLNEYHGRCTTPDQIYMWRMNLGIETVKFLLNVIRGKCDDSSTITEMESALQKCKCPSTPNRECLLGALILFLHDNAKTS